MFGWLSNVAFKGLVKDTYRKICRDHGIPESVGGASFPLALMVAHAAYPKGKWGTADADTLLERLPSPVLGWDEAGKVAHRFVHLNELRLDECLLRQYGVPVSVLLDSCAHEST